MKLISSRGLAIDAGQTEYSCSFTKPYACEANIQHTRMVCDHSSKFRARNSLYFTFISIYFKIISYLFHQIQDFRHRCLQKFNRGSLTNMFATVLDAEEQVLGHPVSNSS